MLFACCVACGQVTDQGKVDVSSGAISGQWTVTAALASSLPCKFARPEFAGLTVPMSDLSPFLPFDTEGPFLPPIFKLEEFVRDALLNRLQAAGCAVADKAAKQRQQPSRARDVAAGGGSGSNSGGGGSSRSGSKRAGAAASAAQVQTPVRGEASSGGGPKSTPSPKGKQKAMPAPAAREKAGGKRPAAEGGGEPSPKRGRGSGRGRGRRSGGRASAQPPARAGGAQPLRPLDKLGELPEHWPAGVHYANFLLWGGIDAQVRPPPPIYLA